MKAVKKRAWEEEDVGGGSDSDAEAKPPPPPPEPEAPKPKARKVAAPKDPGEESEDDLEAALEAALEKQQEAIKVAKAESNLNPVVWMDLSVAGKHRGRVHFELYRDIVPDTADNFRLLCKGVDLAGRRVGYAGSELHKVMPGKLLEGGEFDCSASGKDFPDESFKLTHTKGGLLSMCGAGRDANSSRFQVVMRPSPELDNKQVVFGHVLPEGPKGNAADRIHVLHWVEAVGNARTGDAREAVVIEDCGECSPDEAKGLVSAPRPTGAAQETQEERYARAGLRPPKLHETVQRENLADVLELTDDLLEGYAWEVKKAQRLGGGEAQDKVKDIEAALKPFKEVLEEAKYRAGTVQGERGALGRKAQSQQLRLRDLQEDLSKLF